MANGFSYVLGVRPAILGISIQKSSEYNNWDFSTLLLGGPIDESTFYCCSLRLNGQIEWYGRGLLKERSAEIYSCKGPGLPVISAKINWYGNTLTVSGLVGVQVQKKQVTKIRLLNHLEEFSAG
jgi:hypothetical protein